MLTPRALRPRILPRTLAALRPRNQATIRSQHNMSLWHPRFSHPGTTPGFSSLFRMLDDFERYAGHQLGGTHSNVASFSPKFDVTEHEKDYVLQGELPGVTPENVEIEFTDEHTLVVRGHTERTHTEGDPALLESGPGETKTIEGNGGGGKKVAAAAAKGKEAGEASEEVERPKPKYWLSERSYGEFSRVFNFPSAVDQDTVRAKFKDGVLDITVPKAVRKGGRKIAIQ